MSEAVYDTTEGEFVDFATLEEWTTIDKSKDARIEELIAERDEAWKRAGHAEKMWGKTEVKLAKAVEALEFYATLIGEKHECPWHMLSDDFGEKARTTLAELTGGKDE